MASKYRLKFNNHASFSISNENTILIIDPWIEGNAFNNGWALLDRTTSIEGLIEEIKSFQHVYIWFSHEHSDHFSIPFIKSIAALGHKNLTVLFQETLDKRVIRYLLENKIKAIEIKTGEIFGMEGNIDIAVFPHKLGDSYCAINIDKKIWILNINDCLIKTVNDSKAILQSIEKLKISKIDFLFTQFGYANWMGNKENTKLREVSAETQIQRISYQISVLKPRFVIPFASFVFFCQEENFYLNDMQNTPKKLRESKLLGNYQNKIYFLKPEDYIDLTSNESIEADLKRVTDGAETHWNALASSIKPIDIKKQRVEIKDIENSGKKFKEDCKRYFFIIPHIFEMIGFFRPLNVYITDLNVTATFSYVSPTFINEGCIPNWDISLSSTTLSFILDKEYGFNTTNVNGLFQINNLKPSAYKNFINFFSTQELIKNGYTLHSPIKSLAHFISLIYGLIINKDSYSPY